MTVLVVAAHPDDEVLGCGGTIARLARQGHEVYLAILGEGITSRYQRPELADRTLLEGIRQRSRQVAQLLGVKDLFQFQLPDNRFDTVPLLGIVKIVEDLLARVNPDIIYTHHGGDLNIDHLQVHRAVLTATRPGPGQSVKEVYAFETPSSTEWAFGQFSPVFTPSLFVDIECTLYLKIQAMELYETETRAFPHPRSSKALIAIAQRWGTFVGLSAAEPFEVIRMVR
jgi:LmbE family N-acetylglucosaminyl deacetylase